MDKSATSPRNTTIRNLMMDQQDVSNAVWNTLGHGLYDVYQFYMEQLRKKEINHNVNGSTRKELNALVVVLDLMTKDDKERNKLLIKKLDSYQKAADFVMNEISRKILDSSLQSTDSLENDIGGFMITLNQPAKSILGGMRFKFRLSMSSSG